MSREREGELIKYLQERCATQEVKCVVELLTLRRASHLTKLEDSENPEERGRSKECKDLLKKIFMSKNLTQVV